MVGSDRGYGHWSTNSAAAGELGMEEGEKCWLDGYTEGDLE